LVERSGVSTGAGYRVVDFLERQDLLEHEPRHPITRVDWRPILERWSRDFELNLGDASAAICSMPSRVCFSGRLEGVVRVGTTGKRELRRRGMDVAIGLPSAVPGTTGAQLVEWARRGDARGFSSLGTIDG
jgi:hypothetical protein